MIHETAIIAPGAEIDSNVEIGPYAVVGEHVRIGSGTRVGPHAVIEGRTEIGCDNQIFQFASVGAIPQDLKYHGEETHLKIGDRNRVREFVTIHLGTEGGGGTTRVGNDNLLMAYVHVAHDCVIGNHVVLANAATLAGHVEIDDYAILGGLSAVHQFTRIGCHVMASGGSMIGQDAAPYTIVQGDRARTVGLNLIGLKRRGFDAQVLTVLKQAYRMVFRSNLTLEEAVVKIENELETSKELSVFVDFLKSSERGLTR